MSSSLRRRASLSSCLVARPCSGSSLPRPARSSRDNAPVASTAADTLRGIGIRLSALAQDGLTFAASDYDLDRYRQVGQLAVEMLSVLSGRPADELAVELGRDS